jgi:hypothetical protein
MKIYLSALGWVPEKPVGNRLRWVYPVDKVKGNHYYGLPETIIVERANLNEDIPVESFTQGPKPNLVPALPYSWWDNYGDVQPFGFMLPKNFPLQSSVQGVHFTYSGSDTLLRIMGPDGEVISSHMVQNNDVIISQAHEISNIQVFAFGATLKALKTIDLFRDRQLPWKDIATINVADTVNFSLIDASKRYNLTPTIKSKEWDEFVEVALKATESNPFDDRLSDEPSMWKAFQLLMGIRWEYAVLFGHGFLDGPHADIPEKDWINQDLILEIKPTSAVAYRIRDARTNIRSCVAVCLPQDVHSLQKPTTPIYKNPKVRLTYESDPEKLDVEIPKFVANYKIGWTQADVLALGVEIQEEIKEAGADSASKTINYTCRTKQPDEQLLEGMIERSQDVPFHDSKIRCKAWAVDGWDRVSSKTAWSSWTKLDLEHYPQPPNLINVTWNSGTATLHRQKGDDIYPGWKPDPVIEKDPNAKVFVYRRKTGQAGVPSILEFNVVSPVLVKDNHYKVEVLDAFSLNKFEGGYMIQQPYKEQITGISGSTIYFDTSPGGDGTTFSAGKMKLQENPLNLSLWDKVAEFYANNLPDPMVFQDYLPEVGEIADVLSYHTRIIYLGGRIGPPSNTVQAMRIPKPPDKPKPFTVDQIGIDYYNRTMIKITFTQPVSGGKYTVWWARGKCNSIEAFGEKAVQGVMQAQSAYKNLYLYDILAIPLPQKVSSQITIGVQRVGDGGAQSRFETLLVDLPPLIP